MKRYNYNHNKDKSLYIGIAGFISSFLFFGFCVLIYFLKLHKSNISAIDSTVTWIITVIFLLAGVCLHIWSIVIIIYNIRLIKKGLPYQKDSENVYINTSLQAGVLALVISIIFTLVIIFVSYPGYMSGENVNELIVFSVLASLFFIYSMSVFIYNIFKKR